MTDIKFSEREEQIFNLALLGLRRKEIVDRVFLSPKTVAYHMGHILRKTGVANCKQLIAKYRRTDPLPEPGLPTGVHAEDCVHISEDGLGE